MSITRSQVARFTVNGCKVVDAEAMISQFGSTPAWMFGVNSVMNPSGPAPGRGRFLLDRADYDANFPETAPYSIRATRASSSTTSIELRGYVTVRAYAALNKPGSPMVVEVADIRHLAMQSFARQDFTGETRQEIVDTIKPMVAPYGDNLTLPEIASESENLLLDGMAAINALWEIGTRTGYFLLFDPFTGLLKFEDHSERQDSERAKISGATVNRRWQIPSLMADNIGNVAVYFEGEPLESVDVSIGGGQVEAKHWGTRDAGATEESRDAEAQSMRGIWQEWVRQKTADRLSLELLGIVAIETGARFSCVTWSLRGNEIFTGVEIGHHPAPFLPRQRRIAKTSVELRRCSDGLVVYAENVDTSEGEKLLDLAGQTVALAPSALLDSDCWQVVSPSDCLPSVCPVVCFVFDDCSDCGSCFELRPCDTGESIRYVSVPSLCGGSGGAIRDGDTVLMSNDICYRVFRSDDCPEIEDLTVVRRLPSCSECLECYTLIECWGSGAIQIYKDGHQLENEDIVEIGGVCYTVAGQSSNCDEAFHTELIRHENCVACGCFLLTPCPDQPGVATITTVGLGDGSAVDELADGQFVRLDNGNCYAVSRTDAGCESSEPFVVVQEVYPSCETCRVYLLRDCENPTVEITTYSDLSEFPTGEIIRRAEDERCYLLVGEATWTEFAVEVTVEETYDVCLDCTSPKYQLEPTCPSCDDDNPGVCDNDPDAEQVAGGGSTEVTDHDLSDFVGQFAKYDGKCYFVTEAANAATTTLPMPIEVSGPFEDCETCQKTCLWVVEDVVIENGELKKKMKRIIVDKICSEKEGVIAETMECPP